MEGACIDVQLATTPATFYYIDPRTPEVADAYRMECDSHEPRSADVQFGESTKKGAGRFVVNDILDIQPAANAQITGPTAAASALTLDQPGKKDEVPDTQIATSSSLAIKESGSKNNDMPGTPPTDVIETVAKTIVSTIPHHPFEPHPTREDSSAAGTPKEPKAPTAKRSLNRDLSLEAKKERTLE
ncbi:hypothetical protein Tco_0495963, partial [Tanacetum coccineum]